jgi:hypothetical protein
LVSCPSTAARSVGATQIFEIRVRERGVEDRQLGVITGACAVIERRAGDLVGGALRAEVGGDDTDVEIRDLTVDERELLRQHVELTRGGVVVPVVSGRVVDVEDVEVTRRRDVLDPIELGEVVGTGAEGECEREQCELRHR